MTEGGLRATLVVKKRKDGGRRGGGRLSQPCSEGRASLLSRVLSIAICQSAWKRTLATCTRYGHNVRINEHVDMHCVADEVGKKAHIMENPTAMRYLL
jgi:hypothetical protein